MRARILLTTSLLLLSSLLGSTQDAAPTPDFSDGFKQLAALGLPALDANAKWVTSRDGSIPYELRNAAKSLKGSGWLLPAVEGKAQILQLGDVAPIETKPTSASPDLAKDVAIIIAAINKDAKNIDQDASDSLLNNRYSSSTIAADLLLFATQLYQTGHPELANQLAFALFSAVPSRETVVDGAIDKFASALYTKAATAFFDTGDWAAYEKSLTELTQRFPRGWSSRDAVALFLPQVAKQATGEKPPAPTLPDTAIDPRALAILSELAEPPTPAARAAADKANQERRKNYLRGYDNEYGDSGSNIRPLWLLDSPADPKPDAPAMERLMALKMAALPALAALLGDPFLTHSANGSSYSSRSYYSSNEGPEEVLLRKYQSLHRPSTRGEIAKQLLLATLPDSDDSSGNQPDDETLRQQVLEFWTAHKEASREQLAAVFLSEGSRNQVAQAARLLATATDPQSHQIFEAHVLGLDPALGAFEQVQIYLRARKTAGKPFFDAYAKLVRSQTPADAHLDENASDETTWLLKQSGGVEKMLKSLGSMVSPVPPRTLAVQIAKGKPADAKEAINGLEPLMADLSPTKQLHAYLEGANAATDASVRARFLVAALDIRWEVEDADEEEPTASSDEKKSNYPRKISDPEANVWRKLLADQRAMPKDFGLGDMVRYVGQHGPLNLTTIADLAALSFEASIDADQFYATFQDASVVGKPSLEILKENVTARLAGQPVTPLPDSDKVTEERLAAIVAEAGGKPPGEIHPYLKTLTPDERAAWRDWLNDPEDLPLPDAVKTLRATIVSKYPGDDRIRPPAKYTSSIEPGFQITPDNLLKYIESISPKIAEFSPYLITTSDADFGPGQQVAEIIVSLADAPATPPANDSDESSADSETSDDEESPRKNPLSSWQRMLKDLHAALKETPSATAAVNILVRSRREGESSNLTVLLGSDGKLTVLRKPDGEAPAETPQEALKKVILADEPAPIYLRILTRAHADILFKDAEDEDSNILPSP